MSGLPSNMAEVRDVFPSDITRRSHHVKCSHFLECSTLGIFQCFSRVRHAQLKPLFVDCKENGSTVLQSNFVRNTNDFVCVTNDLFVITNALLRTMSS